MKLSLQWIQEFVEPPECTPKELGLRLTLSTAEIEGQETLDADTLYDIDNKSLTHRPDLWGHYGFAREVAAIFKKPLKPLSLEPLTVSEDKTDQLFVESECEADLCPRYNALVIENVKVEPSPEWIQTRLEKAGARPINNIVDLTNLVLFELGQPLHAFDRSKLKGDQLRVRMAKEGEKIKTLDGGEHALSSDMMVIADAQSPTAIAGVMGGAESEVDESTTTLVLESANFHPTSVRRTAAALGIRTESSMRFEKGLDPVQTELAVQRFWTHLKAICPEARIVSQLYDVDRSQNEPIVIQTSSSFINHKLGTDLPHDDIVDILSRLSFAVAQEDENLSVTVPSFRATGDVSIAEDLVEEVGRIFGYDNITPVAPMTPVEAVAMSPLHQMQAQLRQLMSQELGYSEVLNYAFVGEKLLEQVGLSSQGHLELRNTLSVEHRYMRTDLVPNMLWVAAENQKHTRDFCIYELDRVFFEEARSQTNFEHERFEICGLLSHAKLKANGPDAFYELKGDVELLLSGLPLEGQYQMYPPSGTQDLQPWCHPGRTAVITFNQVKIGYLTQVHPKIAHALGLKGQVTLFVLNVDTLLNLPKSTYRFDGVQKYPTVPFDVSLICDEKTLIGDVTHCMQETAPHRIKEIALFDVYQGENIGEGKKSLAFSLTFASPEHTLSPDEITTLQDGVVNALENAGYQVRKG